MKYKCPILLGATGTGKTSLVAGVAKFMPVEIIACDKFYSYSYFNASVCHSKDDYTELRANLIGFRHPTEPLLDRNLFSDLIYDTARRICNKNIMPIVEGCSVGYISAIIQNSEKYSDIQFFPKIGVLLQKFTDIKSFFKNKVIALIENGALQEVEYAIKNNWTDSYIIKKSMLANPLYRYIEREISLETAIDIATENFIRIAKEEEEKFRSFTDVIWIEHISGKTEKAIKEIVSIIS